MTEKDQHIVALIQDETTREKGFSLFLDQYQEPLYWVIRRIIISHEDSNDVLQNTCVKIWQGLAHFRKDAKLYTWAYQIAVNESLNYLKKMKKQFLFLSFDNEKEKLLDLLHSDPYFDGDALEMKFQEALLNLPKKQRLVFNMKYFEAMKYEEISEILGTSEGALKASYHIAQKKLKQFLTEK